ncbi:MAG: hypothetical protein FJY98_03365 [Candidatus Liptonbacteria bacterium]|nr:hypothetical protein [Candidatus Liptonbacteria bacterium]
MPEKLTLISAYEKGPLVVGQFNYAGRSLGVITFLREKEGMRVDYPTYMASLNVMLSTQIKTMEEELEVSREEVFETIVEASHPNSKIKSEALWIPLSMRQDLQPADNIPLVNYKDAKYGFTIQYPVGWEVFKESTDDLYSIFFIAPAVQTGNKLRGSVVVNVAILQSVESSAEAVGRGFEGQVVNDAKNLGNQWIIKEKTKIEFAGLPAYRFASTKLRTFDEGKTYVRQVQEDTLFTRSGLVYDLAYKHNSDNFESLKPLGERVLNTFDFGN